MNIYEESGSDPLDRTDAINNVSYQKPLPKMRYLSYAWLTVKNVIAVTIMVEVYAVASTKFEAIVFVLLVLIYLSTRYDVSSLLAGGLSFRQDQHFLHLLKLLKDPLYTGDQRDAWLDALGDAHNTLRVATVKLYINGVFSLIIFLYSLYELVTVLQK